MKRLLIRIHRWILDIWGALTVQVLIEYLELWEVLEVFHLNPDVPDQHKWRFIETVTYSCCSAYLAFFVLVYGCPVTNKGD